MRSRAKIGEPAPTAAWRGLVRPVHQLPGRSARLGNLTAGDLRRAARDLCRRASRAAFRARSPVCSARAGAARAGDSLNARPPRAVAKPRATSGGRFCEVSLRARTKGRAKSWTLRSVANAKWSTTGNFQVASCLWTPSWGCPFAGYGHAILGSPCVALIPITVRISIVGAVMRVSIVVGIGITIVVVVVVWCRGNRTAEEAKAKPKTD